MRIHALLTLLVGLSFVAAAPERHAALTDLETLQGPWQAISAEVDGEAVSPDVVKSLKMVIKCDRLLLTGFDHVRTAEEVTFTLDPKHSPKRIDFQDLLPDMPLNFGIYSFDGETLRLCVDRGGKLRPEQFISNKGTSLLIFQRPKDDARPFVRAHPRPVPLF